MFSDIEYFVPFMSDEHRCKLGSVLLFLQLISMNVCMLGLKYVLEVDFEDIYIVDF